MPQCFFNEHLFHTKMIILSLTVWDNTYTLEQHIFTVKVNVLLFEWLFIHSKRDIPLRLGSLWQSDLQET